MLISVINAAGTAQTIVAQGQETLTDISGTLPDDQPKILSAQNPLRSGLVFQNIGANPMTVSELDPNTQTTLNSWNVSPGLYWPPPGYPPVTVEVRVQGTAGDSYVAREW